LPTIGVTPDEMPIQGVVMPFNFASIRVRGKGYLSGSRMLEMHGLTGERTESCADEEKP
jgi:hypothetical protein